jgi:hypothetical protein
MPSRRKHRLLRFAGFAIATLGFGGLGWSQASSTLSLDNGLRLSINASLGVPAESAPLKINMFRATGDSFYRVFRDQNDLAIFAYELEVSRGSGEDEFSLTAKPAEDAFASRFPGTDGGKPVPTLSTSQEFVLTSGGIAEIGLFALEGQGLRVVDVARVALIQPGVAEVVSPSDEPSTLFRFSGLQVSIDGTPVKPGFGGTVIGKYAMFYIPGRGAYFFSTDAAPPGSFTKAGSVDHDRMRFTLDNEVFDCAADAAILTGPDAGEIWVYHDPGYKPTGDWTTLRRDPEQVAFEHPFAAAADSLQWWLP